MNVSIIIIGDELLLGQVTDTNSGYIARHIAPYGWNVTDIQTVSDSAEAIKQAISRAFQSSQIVLTTGGLGPTKDDITKAVLRDYFGGEMVENTQVLENIKNIVARRGFKLNRLTEAQAIVPSSARIIQNRVGTAPIMWFEVPESNQVLVAMPGVPFETQEMFSSEVFPALIHKYDSSKIVCHHTIMVEGITESDLAERLADWESSLPHNFHLAYLPCPGYIRLRLDGIGEEKSTIEHHLSQHIEQLKKLCGDNMLYNGDKKLAEILLETLLDRHLTVGSAESCTGGNIAHQITLIPGSSAAMKGAVVAYSNEVKINVLNVDPDTISTYGAVSQPVVEMMVKGTQKVLDCDVAVATSGIAGPTGGSAEKPVGTVCISAACSSCQLTRTFHFPGDRHRVIERATNTALIMAIRLINLFFQV